MIKNNNKLCNDVDAFIYANEIRRYLPTKIFDAHTHLLVNKHYPGIEEQKPWIKDSLLENVNMALLEKWWAGLFPDSDVSGLVLGYPQKGCDISGINAYLAENVVCPHRFSILCSPQMSAEQLESCIRLYKPAGLKPYMCFAERQDYGDASISEIIPEYQIALADKYGLAVKAMIFPDNQWQRGAPQDFGF